jgi:hypothetical protein
VTGHGGDATPVEPVETLPILGNKCTNAGPARSRTSNLRRMQVDIDVTVNRPVDQVFDTMADARNEPSWNSQVTRTELVSAEPIGEGAHFKTVNRGQEYDAVITTYDRPDDMAFTVTGKPMTIVAHLSFHDLGNGSTRLAGTFDLQPKGFMKLMLPLLRGAIRKDFPKQFDSFKSFCESRA